MFNDIKILGKQSFIYGIGMILSSGLGFFLIPLYTHYLSPKEYGIMEMLDLSGGIISIFLAMGITSSILRFHAYYDDQKEKDQVISTALLFAIFSGVFFTLILIRYSSTFSQIIFTSKEYSVFFPLVFVNIYLSQVHTHCKTIFRAKGKPVAFICVSIVVAVVAIALNIYFITVRHMGIKGIYYSSIITLSTTTIILLVRWFTATKISFSIDKLKTMLRYGVFFIPTLLLGFVINSSDRYFLRMFTDLQTVGLYALGYKIGMIIMFLVGSPFEQVWGAYAFEIEKKDNAKEVFGKVLTYYMLISVFVALCISILSKEIISIIASPSFLNAYTVIPLIALSMVFYSSTNIVKIGILIKRKTFYLPIISALVALINIILNIILIPKYGMIGAALSTIISFSILPLATYWFSNRFYPIQFELLRLLKIMFCALIIYSMTILVDTDDMVQSLCIKLPIISMFPVGLLLMRFCSDVERALLSKAFVRYFHKIATRHIS